MNAPHLRRPVDERVHRDCDHHVDRQHGVRIDVGNTVVVRALLPAETKQPIERIGDSQPALQSEDGVVVGILVTLGADGFSNGLSPSGLVPPGSVLLTAGAEGRHDGQGCRVPPVALLARAARSATLGAQTFMYPAVVQFLKRGGLIQEHVARWSFKYLATGRASQLTT